MTSPKGDGKEGLRRRRRNEGREGEGGRGEGGLKSGGQVRGCRKAGSIWIRKEALPLPLKHVS